MPPWFQVFFAQYVRQREELKTMILNFAPAQVSHIGEDYDKSAPVIRSTFDEEETQPTMDPATFKRLSLNITLLEGGILFHSIFVGMVCQSFYYQARWTPAPQHISPLLQICKQFHN